jgi:hypothetical protein
VDILEVLDLLVKDIDINSIARRLVLYSESLSFLTNPPDFINKSKLGAKLELFINLGYTLTHMQTI